MWFNNLFYFNKLCDINYYLSLYDEAVCRFLMLAMSVVSEEWPLVLSRTVQFVVYNDFHSDFICEHDT